MLRILLAATAALTFAATAADAGSSMHHKRHTHYQQHHQYYGKMWSAPVYSRTARPRWAGPNECFFDEGYGRFSSCNRR